MLQEVIRFFQALPLCLMILLSSSLLLACFSSSLFFLERWLGNKVGIFLRCSGILVSVITSRRKQ
ncbi:hypothetical protein HanIR_Chr05g0219591 [Helianthus annuus]|uniref:Uncharacterized protein n=1 Tax=Helianthus annuus TaxID=4232 RepID=A0A251UQS9_HELAN|nr:hypothetical protein HanIR_Chr05g0219591 [Helianthus annuus]